MISRKAKKLIEYLNQKFNNGAFTPFLFRGENILKEKIELFMANKINYNDIDFKISLLSNLFIDFKTKDTYRFAWEKDQNRKGFSLSIDFLNDVSEVDHFYLYFDRKEKQFHAYVYSWRITQKDLFKEYFSFIHPYLHLIQKLDILLSNHSSLLLKKQTNAEMENIFFIATNSVFQDSLQKINHYYSKIQSYNSELNLFEYHKVNKTLFTDINFILQKFYALEPEMQKQEEKNIQQSLIKIENYLYSLWNDVEDKILIDLNNRLQLLEKRYAIEKVKSLTH